MADLKRAREGYEGACRVALMLGGMADLFSASDDLHGVDPEGVTAILRVMHECLARDLDTIQRGIYDKLA